MVTVTLIRPLSMLLTEPIVLLCSLYSSLNFAVLFCFLACVPLIYTTVYGFSLGHCGLVFIALALGCTPGAIGLIVLDHCAAAQPPYTRQRPGTDESAPLSLELTLWPAMLGGPLMAGSSLMFAWTTTPVSTRWMCGIIAVGVFGCANIMLLYASLFLCRSPSSLPSLSCNLIELMLKCLQVSTALYLTVVYGAGYYLGARVRGRSAYT
ncbi:hypothetical protein BDW75DRAFT_121044 [Aspergillus navahoensis]